MTKIVIPTDSVGGLDATVAEHFGRCSTYTFLDGEGNVIELIKNTSEHMGGTGLPPEIMKKNGADILMCKGLGSRALSLCNDLGIEVYVNSAEKVKDLFALWKNKMIKKAESFDTCDDPKI